MYTAARLHLSWRQHGQACSIAIARQSPWGARGYVATRVRQKRPGRPGGRVGSGERDRKICWKRKPRRIATLNTVGECCAERRTHARTERRLRESRTGWIRTGWNQICRKSLGANQFVPRTAPRGWVESTQSMTPLSAFQSERGVFKARSKRQINARVHTERPKFICIVRLELPA